MKIVLLALWPVAAWAQLEFVADESQPVLFAGKPQQLRVAIRNTADKEVTVDAPYRLFQLSATAAVPVGEAQLWKKLRVLAGQTVLEELPVTLPAVRSTTRFRVECPGIGRLTVTALPEDALKCLTGEDLLGVFDPNDKLKPTLKAAKVEFADFESEPRDVKLALVLADKLPESILTRVKRGMAAVWFKPTRVPTAYAVRLDAGTVVVTALPVAFDSAAAQANLIRYAELALTTDALQLPSDNQTQ